MIRFYIGIQISCIAFLIISCSDTPETPERKAVIEGTFDSNGFPTVLFSSSIVPGIDGNIADAMINWGKVTISDGEKEVVLTGYYDSSCLPPFRYTTNLMEGEPGKRYKVTAHFKDLYAESTVVMPYPVAIDSLTFAPADVDTLRAVTLHFTSPDETPSYFYLSLQPAGRGAHPQPCMLGTIRTDLPDSHYSLAVLRPKLKINNKESDRESGEKYEYQAQLAVGEEWVVRLNRVEETIYNFWKAYDNLVIFGTSPFISTSDALPTNIDGGYGIWSVQGSSSLFFKVE